MIYWLSGTLLRKGLLFPMLRYDNCINSVCTNVFLNNFWRSPFRGATDTPVLDLWLHLPWVSKPGWIPHLRAMLPACNEFLRFTSCVTPADCIEVSMAAEPFRSTCPQALVEVNHSATPARLVCTNVDTSSDNLNLKSSFRSIHNVPKTPCRKIYQF